MAPAGTRHRGQETLAERGMGALADDDKSDRVDAIGSGWAGRSAPEKERQPDDPGGHEQCVKQIEGRAEQRPHRRRSDAKCAPLGVRALELWRASALSAPVTCK